MRLTKTKKRYEKTNLNEVVITFSVELRRGRTGQLLVLKGHTICHWMRGTILVKLLLMLLLMGDILVSSGRHRRQR